MNVLSLYRLGFATLREHVSAVSFGFCNDQAVLVGFSAFQPGLQGLLAAFSGRLGDFALQHRAGASGLRAWRCIKRPTTTGFSLYPRLSYFPSKHERDS